MLVGVDDKPGVVAQIFGALADENISVDMIIQNAPSDAPLSKDSAPTAPSARPTSPSP